MTSAPAPQARSGGGPVVSLITDFGLAEPFVGLVHARILATCPAARIVDLTHAIPPFDIRAAAFWLERCYAYFPPGSVHVAVVDPGVGTARRVLVVRRAGHLFLAPDNGLLAGLAGSAGAVSRAVSDATLPSLGIPATSATFHGRDVFAPLAGMLSSAGLRFEELGMPCTDWVRRPEDGASSEPGRVRGRVVWIDLFGNCFSNIDSQSLVSCQLLAGAGPVQILFKGQELPLVRTYGERPPGTPVALVNSFGLLEAAVVEGRASEVLELDVGTAVELRWAAAAEGGRTDAG